MGATCCGNLRNPGAALHTFILLTLDFEKKPSLREFLTDALDVDPTSSITLLAALMFTSDSEV